MTDTTRVALTTTWINRERQRAGGRAEGVEYGWDGLGRVGLELSCFPPKHAVGSYNHQPELVLQVSYSIVHQSFVLLVTL